jgi:hypothetical protein
MDGETEGKAKLTAAWQAAVARMIEAGYNPADVHETMISVGLSGTRRSRISYMLLVGIGIVGVSALLLFSDLISSDPSAIWRTLSGSRNHNSEQQRDKAPLETRQALVRAHREMETLSGDRARLLTDLTRTAEEIEALKLEGARALAGSGEAVRAERAEAERLKHDLAAARSEIEALKLEGARALAGSGEAVRAAEAKGAEQQEALGRERDEAERLKHDLAAARSEIEALKLEGARALAASGEAVRAAEAKGAEQISQDQTSSELEPQRTISSGLKPDSTATVSTLSQTSPEQALLARANTLLKDRDISGARLVLERALQAGSSRAAFQLAETYDPRQLTRWRAHGVRGDWAKAEALYLRAHNDGIMEAKERIATIR